MYSKRFLPNYGVFDEDRYFAPGRDLILLEHGKTLIGADRLRGHVAARAARDRSRARRCRAARQHLRLAVLRRPRPRARGDVRHARARQLVLRRVLQHRRRPGRADLRRALRRASTTREGDRPRTRFRGGAARRRHRAAGSDRPAPARRAAARARARARGDPAGGGHPRRRARAVAEREQGRRRRSCRSSTSWSRCGCALELGLRDYVDKNGFREVVVGVSGGIDSAVTAALAAEALGRRPRALRLDAVALLVGGDARRRAAARREPRLVRSSRFRSARSSTRSTAALADAVRRDASPISRRRTSRRARAASC